MAARTGAASPSIRKDGILVANYNNMANYDRLLTREEADKLGLKPINVPHKPPPSGPVEWGPQAGSPYAIEVRSGLAAERPG